MKKILALVLAIAMLSSVALAAGEATFTVNSTKYSLGASIGTNKKPGEKINIYKSDLVAAMVRAGDTETSANGAIKAINTEYYSVSSIKYQEGRKLIDRIWIDDVEDRLRVGMVYDYSNASERDFRTTFTLKGKKQSGSSAQKPADIAFTVAGTAGYAVDGNTKYIVHSIIEDTTISLLWDEIETDDEGNKTQVGISGKLIYQFKEISTDTDHAAYTDLEFETADDDVEVQVARIFKDEKYYLWSETDTTGSILDAYADTGAEISFLYWGGKPTFKSTAKMLIYKDDVYVYEIKDGKLVATDAAWDDDEGCMVLKTRTLGSYVFSDIELEVGAYDTDTDTDIDIDIDIDATPEVSVVPNPETGAANVLGIASALAVVSMVAAAAVSNKK